MWYTEHLHFSGKSLTRAIARPRAQGVAGGRYYGAPSVVVVALPAAPAPTVVVVQPVVTTYVINAAPVLWPPVIPFYDPFVWWCAAAAGCWGA